MDSANMASSSPRRSSSHSHTAPGGPLQRVLVGVALDRSPACRRRLAAARQMQQLDRSPSRRRVNELLPLAQAWSGASNS